MINASDVSISQNSQSERDWRQAYTVSFARREVAFAFHDDKGNTYRSRLVRIGNIPAELFHVFIEPKKQKILQGEADIMLYTDVVPGIDVWASVSDLGVEWNTRIKNNDAPKIIEFEAEVPYDTPNAQGEIASTDAKGNWAEVTTNTKRETNGSKEIMRTVKEFTGRVSIRDPITRKRSWSSDVSYPVRIR